MEDETLYLVDINQFVHRAHHATKKAIVFHSVTGMPTNLLHRCATMLVSLLRKVDPRFIGVIQDVDRSTHRRALYPGYKANRTPLDPVIAAQLEHVPRLVNALGLQCVGVRGYEADDVIASYTLAWDGPVVIVSNDKDMMQLVNDARGVSQYDPTPERQKLYRDHDVLDKWNVWPDVIPDLLAIMGDTTDGFLGAPNVGPKAASALIRHFKSLEAVIDNAQNLAAFNDALADVQISVSKVMRTIQAEQKNLVLYKTLATLDDMVDTPITVGALQRDYNPAAYRDFCNEMEFMDLERKLDALEGLT